MNDEFSSLSEMYDRINYLEARVKDLEEENEHLYQELEDKEYLLTSKDGEDN